MCNCHCRWLLRVSCKSFGSLLADIELMMKTTGTVVRFWTWKLEKKTQRWEKGKKWIKLVSLYFVINKPLWVFFFLINKSKQFVVIIEWNILMKCVKISISYEIHFREFHCFAQFTTANCESILKAKDEIICALPPIWLQQHTHCCVIRAKKWNAIYLLVATVYRKHLQSLFTS